MKTITSISGGKTSSMMAVEFPTDHYAVVLTDQIEVAPSDKGLLREIQDRIPGFKASRELDQTLINVLKLEQLIGNRIDWVAAPFTFDELIHQTTDYPQNFLQSLKTVGLSFKHTVTSINCLQSPTNSSSLLLLSGLNQELITRQT